MTRTLPAKGALAHPRIGPLVTSFAVAILNLPRCLAQDATDWQAKAGGRMSFDVASVKPSKISRPPNFSLGTGNAKTPGGRLWAAFPVDLYIAFAYKLAPFQTGDALVNAPKWLRTDFFEINAEAQGNPTKDQMRLMMQSLLTDRFKLAVHFETKEVPGLALTQVNRGKLGPKLLPHSQGPPHYGRAFLWRWMRSTIQSRSRGGAC